MEIRMRTNHWQEGSFKCMKKFPSKTLNLFVDDRIVLWKLLLQFGLYKKILQKNYLKFR